MGKRIRMLCYFCTVAALRACTPLIRPRNEISQAIQTSALAAAGLHRSSAAIREAALRVTRRPPRSHSGLSFNQLQREREEPRGGGGKEGTHRRRLCPWGEHPQHSTASPPPQLNHLKPHRRQTLIS